MELIVWLACVCILAARMLGRGCLTAEKRTRKHWGSLPGHSCRADARRALHAGALQIGGGQIVVVVTTKAAAAFQVRCIHRGNRSAAQRLYGVTVVASGGARRFLARRGDCSLQVAVRMESFVY